MNAAGFVWPSRVGAVLGAWLRWGLATWLNPANPNLPWARWPPTSAAAMLIGLAVAFFAANASIAPEWRLVCITGFLGALTTFSTFSAESVELLMAGALRRRRDPFRGAPVRLHRGDVAGLRDLPGPRLAARQAQAAELPARLGREKVAVARADVAARRRAGTAAQHVLARHELAVVLADRAFGGRGSRGRGRSRCASTPRRRRRSAPACRRPAPRAARADAARRFRRSCPRPARARAAISHSASVGRRSSAQRAKASAS